MYTCVYTETYIYKHIGRGQMGSALRGSLQMGSALQGVPFSPNLSKLIDYLSGGPISVDPICLHSAKGGAVETGCSVLYGAMY